MEDKPKQEKLAAQVSPEVARVQTLIAAIRTNESATFISDASGREELSLELQQAARQLAHTDAGFRAAVHARFGEALEEGLTSGAGARWMDGIYIDAFSRYRKQLD